MDDEPDNQPVVFTIGDVKRIQAIEARLQQPAEFDADLLAAHDVSITKLAVAVAIYDRLGTELVAQIKALKMRIDELEKVAHTPAHLEELFRRIEFLEAGRRADAVGPDPSRKTSA